MKKAIVFLAMSLVLASNTFAQQGFGLGTQPIHSSSIVDISKTNKGLLIPRMLQSQRASISNPADGLLLYDSTTHRFYQYQDGVWSYFINNTFWTKSSVGRYIYSSDSIGIGTSSPDKRLQVYGNIRSRLGIRADNVSVGSLLQANDMTANGNIVSAGGASAGGNIITQDDLTLDEATPIMQMDVDGDNKVFMQVSGEDLRLGTNAGNPLGKIIIRMDGSDIISIDEKSVFKMLNPGSGGNLSVGSKLSRQLFSGDNLLSISSGRVNADGTLRWCSDNYPPQIERLSAGKYKIKFMASRPSDRSSFLVTPGGSAPRIASADFFGPGSGYYLIIQIYDPINRVFVDTEFSFIIHDPANIFD